MKRAPAVAIVLLCVCLLPISARAGGPTIDEHAKTGTGVSLEPTSPLRDSETDYSDFNGDGYADLAVAAPTENFGSIVDAGTVHVLYGSAGAPNILTAAGSQVWTQDTYGVLDKAEAGDRFGAALTYGDFDGDGYDDLAIGVPGEDLSTASGSIKDAGAVNVLYGARSGLTASGDQFWSQNTPYIEDRAEAGDRFGSVLAAGHFNHPFSMQHPGWDSLVVGVPNENIGSIVDAGVVNLIYSANTGLVAGFNELLSQNSEDMPGNAESGDHFGASLATGDWNLIGVGLAIGVPDEDIGAARDAGGVNEMSAGAAGVLPTKFWSQNTGDVMDQAESGDHFGFSLAAVNWMSGIEDDLAIGVFGEDFSAAVDAGAVQILAGSTIYDGLTEHPQALYHQWGQEQAGAKFGFALAAGNFNDQNFEPYIAVGAPFADVGSAVDAGSVTLLPEKVWTQDSTDLLDEAEAGDRFGSWLLGARTSGTHGVMLAVGVPREDVGSVTDAGAVSVLYGPGLFGDVGPIDNQIWHQDSPGVAGKAEIGDRLGASLA